MKLSNTLFFFTLLLPISSVYSQEIPRGVNYKRASESVNDLAKTNLEKALANSDSVPSDFFGEVVVVGPLLWKAFGFVLALVICGGVIPCATAQHKRFARVSDV